MVNTLRRTRLSSMAKWILGMMILLVMVFPIYWVFCIVFSEPGASITVNPYLYPASLSGGIHKIIGIFQTTKIARAYGISIAYVVIQVTGVLLLCSMAAFEFALYNFPGKRFLFWLALVALMVPGIVVLIPTYLLVVRLHWLNTIQGLAVPGLASAFGLFLLTQYMENMPHELFDAAEIDGCNHFQLYWFVGLPLAKNGLITLAVLQFIRTWGSYIWPLVISQKASAYTVSQIVGSYNNVRQYQTMDTIMAINLMALVPCFIFFFFLQRYIVEGVARSGLKG
jgi:multiple sugar transport system permease protein